MPQSVALCIKHSVKPEVTSYRTLRNIQSVTILQISHFTKEYAPLTGLSQDISLPTWTTCKAAKGRKHQSLVSLTVFWCSMTWRLINIPELQGGICFLSCKLLQCTPPLYHTQAWEVLDVKRLHACHPEYEIKGQTQYSAISAPVRSVTPEQNSKTLLTTTALSDSDH